jgi:hypothetical protein
LSLPPSASIVSFPANDEITSSPNVPMIVSSPFVPLNFSAAATPTTLSATSATSAPTTSFFMDPPLKSLSGHDRPVGASSALRARVSGT